MENKFNNGDFEQFVKQNADQYRMFPSEKVWKNIHYSLHTRRRWYSIGLALLLLTTGTVTWVMLNPVKKVQTTYQPATTINNPVKQESNTQKLFITANQPTKSSNHFITNAENLHNRIFPGDVTGATENDMEDIVFSSIEKTANQTISSTSIKPILTVKANSVAARRPAISKAPIMVANPENKNDLTTSIENKTTWFADNSKVNEDKNDIYPLTIESVVNSYIHQKPKKKLSWEVYFSPTISYRKLGENKDFIKSAQATNNSLSYYTTIADINSLVTHKPDLGLQLGFTASYPFTKSLKVLAGLQFNISKYDILAYTYSSEVATIALNTGAGSNSAVSTFSNYRNFNGIDAGWLHNLYFSASLPVGLDLKVGGSSKTRIGISATVQPTYILGDRAYLISTDYKNYVEMPSLTRRWNISGGFEAYASYSTGKIQWKVGPQFRYQMLSSFKEQYPVKEHLYDFGLKVGIMLKNR